LQNTFAKRGGRAIIELKCLETSVLLLLALISDIKTFRIKNSITYSFIAAGALTNLFSHGQEGLFQSMLGAFLPMLALIALYALKMLGAGDIKLFCAIGAIMGAKFALWSIAFSFIAGGIIGAIIMVFRKNALPRFKRFLNYVKTCFLTLSLSPYGDFDDNGAGAKFPYACAAALGTAIAGVFARIYSSSFLQ